MEEEKPKPKPERGFFQKHGQKVAGVGLGTVGFVVGGPLGAAVLGGMGVWAADKMQRSPHEVTE